VSSLQHARDAMTSELAGAFALGDNDRVEAAAVWLRSTGTPLVEVYETLLVASRDLAPEYARTPGDQVRRHRVQEALRDLVARLGTSAAATRGDVLVVVPGGSLHVFGVTALVHVLQDAGWRVAAAPELELDDVEAQLSELADPEGLCLGLHHRSLLAPARDVVRRVRARWPQLRVVVGGQASLDVPDLAGAVGAHATSRSLRDTRDALDSAAGPLSPRELAVLTCVSRGMTNPDTAQHLGVAAATVKTHLDRVYAKLGTSDRTATVALAMRRGWIG
jgi:DNA-binding CsgD family transcriptional regulator